MKKILFVCMGNAGRSQMAEAFFNHMAKRKAQALSAGTEPATAIGPNTVQVMKEIGIDISNNKPKKITLEMLDKADKVITMGCGVAQSCSPTLTETEEWELEDPKGKPIEEVREIRDKIRKRIEKLVKDL